MGAFSFWHLLLVLIVVLIFFGPGRLPGLGNSLGKAIRGFKEGIDGDGDKERVAKDGQKESLDTTKDKSSNNQS